MDVAGVASTLEFVRGGPNPDQLVVDGRCYISRAEIRRRTGLQEKSQRDLYVYRAANGHPEGMKIGRCLYFDEELVLGWYRARFAALVAELSSVDRSGDAEELVDIAEASRVLGFRTASTIRAYLARDEGYFPEAEVVEELPSGRLRRWWRRRTLWEFADRRTGRGRGGRSPARSES